MTDETVTPQQVAADIARELRADVSRWTRGWYARDARGRGCQAQDAQAVCWCLRGAIERRVGDENPLTDPIFKAFDKALGYDHGDDDSFELQFVPWNDDPQRTAADIIALCDKVAAS